MAFDVTTNFKDSNNVDLGKKLVTKDYLLTVYPSLADTGLITTTGGLWVWGSNATLQLGINVTSTTTSRSTPVQVFGNATNWKSVSCGFRHTAAIKTDGTLWLWGTNTNGQLGDNTTANKFTPVQTILGGTNWKSVSCGSFHTAAIKTDGTLWVWGDNTSAALGINNNTTTRSTPIQVFGNATNWKSVSAGDSFTAAIKTDGTLWGWGGGASTYGLCGIGVQQGRSTPVTTILGGTNWKSVSVGYGSDSIATIKTDGTLWLWGKRIALGVIDPILTIAITPITTFAGGNNWKSVSTSGNHTSAIKTDGTLWTWGSNGSGQLGVNDTVGRSTPVTTLLGGTNWKFVTSSSFSTAAIKTDGTLWLWGNNTDGGVTGGQLGINSSQSRSTPVTTTLGGNNWKSVECDNNFSIAIQSVDYI